MLSPVVHEEALSGGPTQLPKAFCSANDGLCFCWSHTHHTQTHKHTHVHPRLRLRTRQMVLVQLQLVERVEPPNLRWDRTYVHAHRHTDTHFLVLAGAGKRSSDKTVGTTAASQEECLRLRRTKSIKAPTHVHTHKHCHNWTHSHAYTHTHASIHTHTHTHTCTHRPAC